jgi:hypothetical protein
MNKAQSRPQTPYEKFDEMLGKVLTMPKEELDAKIREEHAKPKKSNDRRVKT